MMSAEAESAIGFYRRHAERFDEERTRALFERGWLDQFTGLLPRSGRVLDLGCGMGEPVARYLIDHGLRITGVDSSPAMIDLCRTRFPDHEWAVGDMRSLHAGDRFNGIVAWDSFFHLTPDDQRAMFPVFAAHAEKGAALMFTSGPVAGEKVTELWGERLYHASLDPDEYRRLLDENGFDVVRYVAEDGSCGGHTVWLAQTKSPA